MSVFIRLEDFIEKIRHDRDACWSIPLSHSKPEPGSTKSQAFYANARRDYLAQKVETKANRLSSHEFKQYLKTIQNILASHKVILPGISASILTSRQNAILWWSSLTLDEKKSLEIFGNRIQLKKYVKGWNPRGKALRGASVLLDLHDEFRDELIDLGILNKDYLSVVERQTASNKNFFPELKASAAKWIDLGKRPLESVEDLVNPASTSDSFIQLKQLFAVALQNVSSESGKGNYKSAFTHVEAFLTSQRVSPKSTLANLLDEFILTRFNQNYLVPKLRAGELSSRSVVGVLSAVRSALRRATKVKGLSFPFFHDVISYTGERQTLSHKPYSRSEREAITKAILTDIAEIEDFLKPYKKLDIGDYPLTSTGAIMPGKGTLENARYLFENYLNCKPVFRHTAKTPEEKAVINILSNQEVGLHDIYKSWGVLPVVDQHVLAPFLFRLAQVTGMNVEVITALNVDDLVMEHLATGRPCLQYWKERSSGAKELHLDLFKCKLQWLTRSQSKEVASIFETVKELTKEIRSKAEPGVVNRLFIYQSTGRNTVDDILDFAGNSRLNVTYSRFVRKHDLRDEKGMPTIFRLSRFRPSFVSEMIMAGVSLREIQLMLGHSNLYTTIGYLDRLDFNKNAREKVSEALQGIHDKTVKPSAATKKNRYLHNPDRVIFTTPLGGCANVFDPPDFIKKSSAYIAGQPCSQYNKCLSCENVMLTAAHLPELFAMQRDYLALKQRNRVMDTPYGVVVEENLSLLDEILTPATSDFSEHELQDGERLSKFVETAAIDNVGM